MWRAGKRGFGLCVALWLIGVGCLPDVAGATMFIQTTLPERVAQATHVVVATVSKIEAVEVGQGGVSTRVRLAVSRQIKGPPPASDIILEVPGGRTAHRQLVVSGMPEFEVGAQALFLLFRAASDRYTFIPFGIFDIPAGAPETVRISRSDVDHLLWEPITPSDPFGPIPSITPGMGNDVGASIDLKPSNPTVPPPVARSRGSLPVHRKSRLTPDPTVPLFLPDGQITLEGFVRLLEQELNR